MRYILFILLLVFKYAQALEGCSGAYWTSQVETNIACGGITCFERKVLSENGKLCARTIDAAYPEYFTAKIYDANDIQHVTETYYIDPDGDDIIRMDVTDINHSLLYYADRHDNYFYPDGSPMPKDASSPGGRFYEEIIRLHDK